MKITIESTTQMVQVVSEAAGGAVPGRVWVGKTDSGIEVQCVVTLIAISQNENQEQFQRELQECRPPTEITLEVFPLRMVI